MGLRGPPPTPKSELEARGSWLAKHRADELTIEPVDALAPPAHLDKEARRQWQAVVGLLAPRGVLTEADVMALTMLCELWAEDRVLGKKIKRLVVGSLDWNRVRNARSDIRKQLKDMLAKFGLTPADRPRVKLQGQKPEANAKSRFFKPRLAG